MPVLSPHSHQILKKIHSITQPQFPHQQNGNSRSLHFKDYRMSDLMGGGSCRELSRAEGGPPLKDLCMGTDGDSSDTEWHPQVHPEYGPRTW